LITLRSLTLLLALSSVLLAGCATRGSKSTAPGGADAGAKTDAAPDLTRTVPGPVQVLGRVVALDMRTLSVIVELAPYAVLPGDYATRQLIARRDDLQPTARLQSSPYLRGRTLGTRLVAGKPQVGDEVVFLPVAP
jgi:ABC-type Fe3+-hydroxamate transport system substrate-binding protein